MTSSVPSASPVPSTPEITRLTALIAAYDLVIEDQKTVDEPDHDLIYELVGCRVAVEAELEELAPPEPQTPKNHPVQPNLLSIREALNEVAAVVLYLKSGRFLRLTSIPGQHCIIESGKIVVQKEERGSFQWASDTLINRYFASVTPELVAEFYAE